MSRIGKKPISIPEEVEVDIKSDQVTIEGPNGSVTRHLREEVKLEQENGQLLVKLVDGCEEAGNFQGLFRSLLANDVQGVTEDFKKELEIRGVGYRANLEGNTLQLEMGYSHPVDIKTPEGIEFEVEKKKIIVHGIQKDLVGQIAAKIRQVRPPEPYKGKGIRYMGEEVRRKEGKKAISLTE